MRSPSLSQLASLAAGLSLGGCSALCGYGGYGVWRRRLWRASRSAYGSTAAITTPITATGAIIAATLIGAGTTIIIIRASAIYVYDRYRRPHRWNDSPAPLLDPAPRLARPGRLRRRQRAANWATSPRRTGPDDARDDRPGSASTIVGGQRQLIRTDGSIRTRSERQSVSERTPVRRRADRNRTARLGRSGRPPHQDDRGEAHDRDIVLVGDGRLGAERADFGLRARRRLFDDLAAHVSVSPG